MLIHQCQSYQQDHYLHKAQPSDLPAPFPFEERYNSFSWLHSFDGYTNLLNAYTCHIIKLTVTKDKQLTVHQHFLKAEG